MKVRHRAQTSIVPKITITRSNYPVHIRLSNAKIGVKMSPKRGNMIAKLNHTRMFSYAILGLHE